ncbi:glycosyl transferase family 2 [Paenibacillus sp. J53TS2]|uniref:glycosyltransferase family 2 protein n=1 Tax=Paenibacillus sp. J53TS2 TaxID=2807197 RepID=UPI001B2E05C5|nr:glycosyltransferase family 2 protein [Paenibacillus sp. J53TS2]GIP47423.1 glycosyl transferase family 2 [Paenibacillus sp. J53TS2]
MPFLSLCMIVKNEENVIARCLESVKGLADEIIIIDTGSIDRTKEIARSFTDHIFDFQWINDFSAARNEALKKATGKWILILDADEYIVPEEHPIILEELRNHESSDPLGFIMPIYNFTGKGTSTENLIESFAIRLFSNHPQVAFHNPIHEQIKWTQGELFVERMECKIYHTGYTNETVISKNKRERNLAIFEEMKKNKKLDEYDYFTLGNEYDALGDKKKALYYYRRADSKRAQSRSFILHCKYKIITLLAQSGNIKEALDILEDSIHRWPNCVDFIYLKGSYYHYLGYYNHAVALYKQGLDIAQKLSELKQNYWVISPNCSILCYTGLKEIYLRTLDHSNAVKILIKLIELRNNELIHLQQLINILLITDELPSIYGLIKKLYANENPSKGSIRLLQASLLIGNPQLSNLFYEECIAKGVIIPSNYHMHYALVSNQKEAFVEYLSKGDQISDPGYHNRLIGVAYCLWEDESFLNHLIETEDNQYDIKDLYLLIKNTGDSSSNSINIDFIVQILIDLFKSGYYEEYDKLIKNFSSHYNTLANQLGNYFFYCHQFQLAFDYYSALLQQNQLEFLGYMNIGFYYLSISNDIEAMQYFSEAIDNSPYNHELYPLVISMQNPKVKAEMIEQYYRRFPQFRNIKI